MTNAPRPAIRLAGSSHRQLPSSATRRLAIGVAAVAVMAGCGTARWSDTQRTATEQLLLSDAIDRSVDQIDFSIMHGRDVFFDPQYLEGVVDEKYVISAVRQRLLASGCRLRENREDATHVIEARAGVIGTDRQSLLFGVPSVNVPSFIPGLPFAGPSAIPEIPLAKKTKQKGIAKLYLFAYDRATGEAIWQSGASAVASTARDTWILGAGPFQQGSIYGRTKFAGDNLGIGESDNSKRKLTPPVVKTGTEATFTSPRGPRQADSTNSASHTTELGQPTGK